MAADVALDRSAHLSFCECHCDKAACKMLNVWQQHNALSIAKVGHIVKHGIFCCSCIAAHQLLISGCCDVVKVM